VNLFIQEGAERDILGEVERYAALGIPHTGRRFHAATLDGFDALIAMPQAGAPKALRNPKLAGLRTWPVKGFDEFKIYYLTDSDTLTIVRILHGRRDISRILEDET
jgi:toxin ParE1/3/4